MSNVDGDVLPATCFQFVYVVDRGADPGKHGRHGLADLELGRIRPGRVPVIVTSPSAGMPLPRAAMTSSNALGISVSF